MVIHSFDRTLRLRVKTQLPTENNPDSLFCICLDFLSINCELLKGQTLPREICEALVNAHTSAGRAIDGNFGQIFADTKKTNLKKVFVKRGNVTREGLKFILAHKLTHLDISQCTSPPTKLLHEISLHGEQLIELSVGSWKKIEHFPLSNSPNLRILEIHKWYNFGSALTLPLLLKPLKNLYSLNLSEASGMNSLSCLLELPNLRRLYLYRVNRQNLCEANGVQAIQQMTKLTHLDISGAEQPYLNPDVVLARIVESLPNLVWLDISETNLAGRGVVDGENPTELTDIVGLRSRVAKPLEFLGLYETKNDACRRHHIPAKNIAGDANEQQLLTAAHVYMDRPKILERILNEIYNRTRDNDDLHHNNLLLEVILDAMERYERKKLMQISGSATLFFIVKARSNVFVDKTRRRIISALLNGMIAHRDDQFMLRNGCLCLCQFKIPNDVLFDYKRLVDILLYTTTEMMDALFIQRIAIYLLNTLACQVDKPFKSILGEAGAVPRMLSLIAERLKRKLCDDVMEVAWSTLWNVTDETALNCRYFLDWDGMTYFCGCLEKFPDKYELLRNMMGLLGNVAEVASLRPRLMTESYVNLFTMLLSFDGDGIEVSYNAAGVLAHMCSDGEQAWTIIAPTRQRVLSLMENAINQWDLFTERNINYRSFEPILGLLTVEHTPQCQHWATWALANLTKVYPHKYCEVVEAEGGLDFLKALLLRNEAYPKILELAQMVIDNCQRFKNKDYNGLELDG